MYASVGRTLGPRAGFVTGWALLGTYLVFPWVSVSGIAVFATALLRTMGLAPDLDWYPLALGGWALVGLLAAQGIRPTARWLLFAGFESAGSLGEETRAPCRSIPRAMVSAIVAGGIFYVACMLTQTLGFGVDRVGVAEFAGTAAPLDRLAASYIGGPDGRSA